MQNTQLKGALTEQKCFIKCIEMGFTVSKPLFDNARYDFILDTGNNLIDPYKKRPVILVNYDAIKKYITNEKELLVPYNNINSEGLLRCIKPKKIIINEKEFNNILIGLSFNKIYIDGIECILNNNMEI